MGGRGASSGMSHYVRKDGTVVAVSTVGVKNDAAATGACGAGMTEAMRMIEPSLVLLYGGDIGFDFGRCDVVKYANGVTERMSNGR